MKKIDYANLKHISDLIQDVDFYNLEYQELFKILKTKKKINNAFLYYVPSYLPEDEIMNQK